MLTLLTLNPGTMVNGWVFITPTNHVKLVSGDVVCFGDPRPWEIQGDDCHSTDGFVISGFAGRSLKDVFQSFAGQEKAGCQIATFWRRTGGFFLKPKQYIPSEWAKPVPLP